MCETCTPVYNLIVECLKFQEENSKYSLTKKDVLDNVAFSLAWNNRQCLCCFKATKNYDAYNNMIQMIHIIAIQLLQNLDDAAKVIKHAEDWNDTDENRLNLAGEAIWTVAEIEQVLIFVSISLQMNFPLYLVCKHNHICGVDDLSKQEMSILATYCDITEADSLPVMLLRNVCFFCDSGGTSAIRNMLLNYTSELPISLMAPLIFSLSNLRSWLNGHAIETYIFPVRSSLLKFICGLSDESLRQAANCNIIENVQSILKEDHMNTTTFDEEILGVALKYFKSSTLTIRMAGIQQLNAHLTSFNEALMNQSNEDLDTIGLMLAEWFVSNKIVEYIFGPNLHNEIVKHSQLILNFLASESKITNDTLDLIWTAAQQKHCAKQVQDVLILLIKHLKLNNLVYLMDLLFQLEPSQHTESTLLISHNISKCLLILPGRLSKMNQHATLHDVELDVCSSDEPSDESSESDLDTPRLQEQINLLAINTSLQPLLLNEKVLEGLPVISGSNRRRVVTPESDTESSQDEIPRPSRASPTLNSQSSYQLNIQRPVINRDIEMGALSSLPISVEELNKTLLQHAVRRSLSPCSQMSCKSEKDMADFLNEDIVSDEELSDIANKSSINSLPVMGMNLPLLTASLTQQQPGVNINWELSPNRTCHTEEYPDLHDIKYLDIENICNSGHCLLWDLIQDNQAKQLADGLLVEAEKYLSSLITLPDVLPVIKHKFVLSCLNNIKSNQCETISLRLLIKLLTSLKSSRDDPIISSNVMICISEEMMDIFFNNLQQFVTKISDVTQVNQYPSLFGLNVDITVRLGFLSYVYSNSASPTNFSMSIAHMDILWDCMTSNKLTCDYLLSWLHTQVKNRDCHALSVQMYKYIYQHKLSGLDQRCLSMIGFSLFKYLHEMLSQSSVNQPDTDIQIWNIALKCENTDVSLSAIEYINNCYLNSNNLNQEEHKFIDRCMKCVMTALDNIESEPSMSLQVVERALYLLKNHILIFTQRHSYQLKLWQIKNNDSASHRSKLVDERNSSQKLNLTLTSSLIKSTDPTAGNAKVNIEVTSNTLLGEFRADISNHWTTLINNTESSTDLSHGAVRLIFNGRELSSDLDGKSLSQLQLKDGQTVHVSLSSNRNKKASGTDLMTNTPSIIPMMILIDQNKSYFNNLFTVLESLHNLNQLLPHRDMTTLCNRAKVLSRHVWELLMLLPTNGQLLNKLIQLNNTEQVDFSSILPTDSLPRLVYSLQIVEMLSRDPTTFKPLSFPIKTGTINNHHHLNWSEQFTRNGGLKYLLDILLSEKLHAKNTTKWDEWEQETLAYLFRLICQFSVQKHEKITPNTANQENTATESSQPSTSQQDSNTVQERRSSVSKGSSGRRPSVSSKLPSNRRSLSINPTQSQHDEKKLVLPFNQVMIEMIARNKNKTFSSLISALMDAVLIQKCNTSLWARHEVLTFGMAFLVHWAYTDTSLCELFNQMSDPDYMDFLKTLTLTAAEVQMRHEACWNIYNLCTSQPKYSNTPINQQYLEITLQVLLKLLPYCTNMKPLLTDTHEPGEERKQRAGPSSQDYLWLTAQLLDKSDNHSLADTVAAKLIHLIETRPFYEMRHSSAEDEGLIGLLNLMTVSAKTSSNFKSSPQGKILLEMVFDFLFDVPSIHERQLPKCKSNKSRVAAFDLLTELVRYSIDNYTLLHHRLMSQHSRDSIYQWDYWPNEDVRSSSGFVGLQNLGATCYMATCVQHLFMIPQARQAVLHQQLKEVSPEYTDTLIELQKMFAYLLESERKSYNPHSFCKSYQMDHRPLNTGEQKDMTEFFTDLISKLEEMSPELRVLVKSLFGGVLSNNVVSLDCGHVSKTLEEFYTIRCQVSGMKNIFESLDDVCVKDTLDGDNMYTCSKCQQKVRAEKRACFKQLPKILCFNTMRYTFNMVTMLKEKVNTHFSFPQQLNMKDYMESHLLGDSAGGSSSDDGEVRSTEYELIGVTVHTGTADGGHYYSFIRDRTSREHNKPDKWFLFNDAEVKPFDPALIAQECFGGELTSKTYDNISDRFMDFAFEKTNSAYMLFYERIDADDLVEKSTNQNVENVPASTNNSTDIKSSSDSIVNSPKTKELEYRQYQVELGRDLADWIWRDNTSFLQDKSIFCHNYFGFMMQVCATVPTTLQDQESTDVNLLATQLSASFLLETFIHAKEKPTMVQWIELLTKQFSQSQPACQWFLELMAVNDHWPRQILLGCPNQMVRQMYQRLTFHVISQCLKHTPTKTYLDSSRFGVVGFVEMLLDMLESPDIKNIHYRYLTEYFCLLVEFSRQGRDEKSFLVSNGAIHKIMKFYMSRESSQRDKDGSSSECDEEDDSPLISDERSRISCLDKMVYLISILTENCRPDPTSALQLTPEDQLALTDLKFISCIMKEGVNCQQICNIIFSLSRMNGLFADEVTTMILNSLTKTSSSFHIQVCLRVISLLTEIAAGPPGLPNFLQLVLDRFWLFCEKKSAPLIEWMGNTVIINKIARDFCLNSINDWLGSYLITHSNSRTRMCTLYLVTMLVPSSVYRDMIRPRYPSTNKIHYSDKNIKLQMTPASVVVLHKVYTELLTLLPIAAEYAQSLKYGPNQLVAYFNALTACLVSEDEKKMFIEYFEDFWTLFQPRISEPQLRTNPNKQALMNFWYSVTRDCTQNIKLITSNDSIVRNISFNYILADHDDQDVIAYNKEMLASYYGLLHICCERSRKFTRALAPQQNMVWAFQHILPCPHLYLEATDELLSILQLFVAVYPDSVSEEISAIQTFKRKMFSVIIQSLNPRVEWHSMIIMLKILLITNEDRLVFLSLGGLIILSELFLMIHDLYHEAVTASHLLTELSDCLHLLLALLKSVPNVQLDSTNSKPSSEAHTSSQSESMQGENSETTKSDNPEKQSFKLIIRALNEWKTKETVGKHCLLFLNSYTPSEVRVLAIEIVKLMIKMYHCELIPQLASWLLAKHTTYQGSDSTNYIMQGPHMPNKYNSENVMGFNSNKSNKINVRPPHAHFGMFLHHSLIDIHKGQDPMYDQALNEFFLPYHILVDLMVRLAVNHDCINETIVTLSAMVGYEGIALHSPYFPKLWCELSQSRRSDKTSSYIKLLLGAQYLIDYIEGILHDDTASLTNTHIFNFMSVYLPLVHKHIVEESTEGLTLNKQISQRLDNIISVSSGQSHLSILWHVINKANGDLRALQLLFTSQPPAAACPATLQSLHSLKLICDQFKTTALLQITDTRNRASSKMNDSTNKTNVTSNATNNVQNETSERNVTSAHTDDQSEPSDRTNTQNEMTSSKCSQCEASNIQDETTERSIGQSEHQNIESEVSESGDGTPRKKRKTQIDEELGRRDESAGLKVAETTHNVVERPVTSPSPPETSETSLKRVSSPKSWNSTSISQTEQKTAKPKTTGVLPQTQVAAAARLSKKLEVVENVIERVTLVIDLLSNL